MTIWLRVLAYLKTVNWTAVLPFLSFLRNPKVLLGLGIAAMLVYIGVQNHCSTVRDQEVQRKDDEFREQLRVVREQIAEKDGELKANAEHLAELDSKIQQSDARILELEESARRQNEKIRTGREAVTRARSGVIVALPDDELDRRLRALYPE